MSKTVTLDANQFMKVNQHTFSADASDLGFAPSFWPEEIHLNLTPTLGFKFRPTGSHCDRQGNLQAVEYLPMACITTKLIIFND